MGNFPLLLEEVGMLPAPPPPASGVDLWRRGDAWNYGSLFGTIGGAHEKDKQVY